MTRFDIRVHDRSASLEEAVEACVQPDYNRGAIEDLRAIVENQNKLISRMLAVQFNEYGDHFISPEFQPITDDGKLAFILSYPASVTKA